MDMQNVSNLQIPEGEVRTIQDSTNRLIWGRLNYDTKYAGDTFQQTYSGKNLVDALNVTWTEFNSTLTKTDGVFKMTASSGVLARCCLPLSGLVEGTTYTFSCDIHGVSISSMTNTSYVRVRETSSGGSWVSGASYIAQTSDYVRMSVTFTATSVSNPYVWFYISANISNTNNIEIYVKNLQFEVGSQPTSYEPYTGGIPAPSPSYSMPINMVTGVQTVSVSDGNGNSHSYTISLGATELCKIGDYQDYIYKSGNDWYVHKEIDKYTFNGTETWSTSPYGANSWRFVGIVSFSFDTNKLQVISNIFKGIKHADRNTAGSNAIYSANNNEFNIRNTSLTSLAEVQAATNGNYVYYALATPTNTKITNNTFIGQLNDVHEWLTRYGYNAAVTGNLPIIINKTNL